MMNKKVERKGKDITAEAAKKAGKKVTKALPKSFYRNDGKKDKKGNIIPE